MYKTPESPTSPPPTPSPLTLPRSSGEILPVTTPIETLPTRITKQQPEQTVVNFPISAGSGAGRINLQIGELPCFGKELRAFLAHYLKSHVHDQLTVLRGEAAEKLAEALKKFRGLTGTAPLIAIGRQARRERRGLWRGFPIVKKLVHGNFESAGHFFECLDTRDGVTVLHTRNVAALEAGAPRCPLAKALFVPGWRVNVLR